MDRKINIQVYQEVVDLILLYGSESWLAAKSHMNSVNEVNMRCLKRIAKKTRRDKVRNEIIREELQQIPNGNYTGWAFYTCGGVQEAMSINGCETAEESTFRKIEDHEGGLGKQVAESRGNTVSQLAV